MDNIIYKVFKTPLGFYMLDRNTNSLISIDKIEYDALQKNNISNITKDVINKYQTKGYLCENTFSSIEHPETPFVKYDISRKLQQLILQVTQNCNLRCSYCSFSGNYLNRTHNKKSMPWSIAKKSIDYIFDHSSDLKTINISFYGGEPLLEFDLIKECVEYSKDIGDGKIIRYNLTTNATLLNNKEIIEFLITNNFDILISLDGPKEIHNFNRKFSDKTESFDIIMKNLKYIKNNYGDFYKTLRINTVVSDKVDFNLIKKFYESEELLKEISVNISLISPNYFKGEINYNDSYIAVDKFEKFKVILFLIKRINKSSISRLYLDYIKYLEDFYKCMKPIKSLPEKYHHGGPCIAGSRRLFVTCDGNFFPCERVSEDSNIMSLGRIDNEVDINKVYDLINFGKLTYFDCLNCWNLLFCKICASQVDTTEGLSKQKNSLECLNSKKNSEENIKIICFLKENKFDFDGDYIYE